MEKKEMKKLLASLGIASLISAGGMALPGSTPASGLSATNDSAGGADKVVEKPEASG